jgi:hypothetical protein
LGFFGSNESCHVAFEGSSWLRVGIIAVSPWNRALLR